MELGLLALSVGERKRASVVRQNCDTYGDASLNPQSEKASVSEQLRKTMTWPALPGSRATMTGDLGPARRKTD